MDLISHSIEKVILIPVNDGEQVELDLLSTNSYIRRRPIKRRSGGTDYKIADEWELRVSYFNHAVNINGFSYVADIVSEQQVYEWREEIIPAVEIDKEADTRSGLEPLTFTTRRIGDDLDIQEA